MNCINHLFLWANKRNLSNGSQQKRGQNLAHVAHKEHQKQKQKQKKRNTRNLTHLIGTLYTQPRVKEHQDKTNKGFEELFSGPDQSSQYPQKSCNCTLPTKAIKHKWTILHRRMHILATQLPHQPDGNSAADLRSSQMDQIYRT